MRLKRGHAVIAVVGVSSMLALFVASPRFRWAAPLAPVASSVEESAAIAAPLAFTFAATSAEKKTRPASVVPSASGASTMVPAAVPAANAAIDVTRAVSQAPVGAVTDGASSLAYGYGDRTQRRVALTFDAGADVGFAADILDTLAREHAVASFGMTGVWAQQNPELVQRMAAEGHQFINHTWDHASFTGLSTKGVPLTRTQRWESIDRTEAIILRLTGMSTMPLFRPPYGDTDATVLADVGARGYTVTAMWAVDSLGWAGLSAPKIVDRTLRLTSPGAILIFHVGSQSQDSAALPGIIAGLRESGYGFVSMSTLLEEQPPA